MNIPESKEDIAKGLIGKHRVQQLDLKDPFYQLKTGCLVDQLVGQYMSHVLGLGYLVKKENVKKALQSIQKYNKRDGMFEHFNNMRSYAMGDEKALLMASWPNGGRPTIPFPYWAEVMTGFEYTASIGMLYEEMQQEGLDNIKNIRDRYDGLKRNPFDEAECGHHYARAMASWASIIAESGFLFSAVDKSIKFTDKPGAYFWSNGSAWGMCKIEKNGNKHQVSLKVLHGKLTLNTFQLGNLKTKKIKKKNTITEGESLKFQI